MADWSSNVFSSTTVFSVALGFLCLGTQHLSNKTAFSFEAVLMLLAILAAFLSFFSSSEISILGLVLSAAVTSFLFFFSCAFSTFSLFWSFCRIVYLLTAILSLKGDFGIRYSPSATRSAPATGLSKNPGPSVGPLTRLPSSLSLPWSFL